MHNLPGRTEIIANRTWVWKEYNDNRELLK